MPTQRAILILVILWLAGPVLAQGPEPPDVYLMNLASGSSRNPASWPMPMRMRQTGSWSLMFMGQAFLMETQQADFRGSDKFYSTNWSMGSAGHALAGGAFRAEAMLSLEPATVTGRRYAELFQTGETAYGHPIVDAQHPHDFLMSVGLHYVRPVRNKAILHLYYAPVGDPALGPVAFPHRASAFEIPQAPLGHHWQDSTHIADNVATVSLEYKRVRLEASGFYGTEPNENRWNIDWGPMNSYAARFSVSLARNWMAQVSAGRLAHPERQEAGDVTRITASLHYTRRLGDSAWSSSFIWGRNHQTVTRRDSNSYLAETVYPLARQNFLTGRVEVVDKDELEMDGIFRIRAYTGGYTRDIGAFHDFQTGIGFNVSAYTVPRAIQPGYGQHPWGANVFLRVRLRR